ncbi:hypothetical protein D7B24_008492 [Verticillium nonalfalfae]|uniref:Uncharacterized protein n=1 Tax=Verticillium nonalfalfae TaxID=1051616 RepID=A0A3M9Y565_9PEZI|nr:uncharacterized protein D7B24_008492 [Verticillium nonalfalfae]RNJ55444.1 hypothetical protein D7B24_008492 [Verticillium nonalfalfae]
MTKARRGPSLVQARSPPGNKNHNHFHSLQRRNINTNPHINSNNDGPEPHHQHHQHHNRQAPDAAPTPAADSALVTHVVQTVSVIQIVDGNGVPVRVQTQFAEPATVVIDPVAGVTVDYSVYQAAGGIPTAQPEPPATPAPGEVQPGSAPKPAAEPAVDPAPVPQTDSLPYPETNPPPETVPLESSSVLTPAIPSDETVPPTFPPTPMSSEVPLESQDQLPTSAPLTTPPLAFPTLSAGSNSTIPGSKSIQQSRYGNNNSSSLHLLAESGSASSSPYSFLSNSDASSSSLPTTTTSYFTTTSSLASSTGASLSGFYSTASGASGAGGVGGSTPSATATADQDADEAPVETGMVVGSVVGSIAGAALIVFLVLFALKMRKRQQGRVMLGDGNSTNTRGMLTGPNGPPGGNSGASAMVQRSLGLGSAALAGLGAKRASRQASEQPEEAGERGFYRVSGRKLPPVLQAGGDGYTDPRMSVVSNDESVYYRQSTTFFDDPASGSTAPRLALGSPMRPVSGVPIMRSGPARTPVQESNPFADPAPPSHLMVPPLRDAVGRSLTSQDGSRGSVSRFTEEIR